MTKYVGHMTVTREIAVTFEGDFVNEKHRYKAAQAAALDAALEQGLINRDTDSVGFPWIENVEDAE